MRPLQLTISAFGPYAGEVHIPMEDLGEKGVYLITGNTGAGKTTIFDAIIFALYGEASGSDRKPEMLRSKYAAKDTKTFVRLIFSYGGKCYEINRTPRYERLKTRGEGTTVQNPEAEMTFPNGNILTGFKEVTKEVTELIGLDFSQFSQIAMIAQGQFRELLFADTSVRKKIFRNIFRTIPFLDFQEQCKQDTANLDKERKEILRGIEQELSGLDLEWNPVEKEEFLVQVKEQLKADRVEEKRLILENEKWEKLLEEKNQKVGEVRKLAELKRECEEARGALIVEEPKLKEYELLLETEEKKEEKRESQKQELVRLEEEKKIYEDLESSQKQKAKIVAEREGYQKQLESAQTEQEEIERLMKQGKEEQEDYARLEAEYVDWNARREKLEGEKEGLAEVERRQKAYLVLQGEWTQAGEEYQRMAEEKEKTTLEYNEAERHFLDEQAGILAARLKEGEPCPVCGSMSHPTPAEAEQDAPDKHRLEELKRKRDKVVSDAERASRLAGDKKVKAEEHRRELELLLKKEWDVQSLESLEEEIQKKTVELDEREGRLLEEEKVRKQKEERKNELAKAILVWEEKLTQRISEKEKMQNQLAGCKSLQEEVERQIEKLQSRLTFESREHLQEELSVRKQEIKQGEERLKEARENFLAAKEKITLLKNTIETLQKQEKVTDGENLEELLLEQTEVKKKKDELTGVLEEVRARLTLYEKAVKQVETELVKLEKTESKYVWMKALSDTMNGACRGKERIQLETYVQSTYFDRILRHANVRFMVMSDGQYELKRRKEAGDFRSQSGLELSVIDHYNGSERDVRTLSGGESFLASLSLALGLSDEIQAAAGGIRLDTIFIDEGFGSLDDEALEKAMRIFMSLSEGNRLVGIISHVEALKERIDMQITVTKNRSGSTEVCLS